MHEPSEREWLEGLDPRTEQDRRDEVTPVSPVGGEDVARLREQRDRAIGRCGYTVVVEGEEEPCNREATGWRWYQGHDHEDLLDVACIHHENQGGALMVALLARLEAAESARDEALAAVERVRALVYPVASADWAKTVRYALENPALTPSRPDRGEPGMSEQQATEKDARCGALSPESGMPCSLPKGHDHAHVGPHPTGYDGWTVSWANRPTPPESSAR